MKKLMQLLFWILLPLGFNSIGFAADGDTLSVSNGYGLPGSLDNPMTVNLENVSTVKGLYFIVEDVPDVLNLSSATVTARAVEDTVHFTDEGDSTKFIVYPKVKPSTYIQSDSGAILNLSVNVDAEASLGTAVEITITGEQLADENNNPIAIGKYSSFFWIGTKGDVDASGHVDLFDVLRMIDIALVRPPAPTTFESWSGDFDGDGQVTVIDIGEAIDIALGNPLLLYHKSPASDGTFAGVVKLTLDTPIPMADGKLQVPVLMSSTAPVSGVQLSIKYDKKSYKIDAPKLAEMANHMNISARFKDGEIRIMVYSPHAQVLAAGESHLLDIPFQRLSDGKSETQISINAAISATEGGMKLETLVNESDLASTIIPESFALWPNSPNPFNAGTTITYEIPQNKSGMIPIQLLIYNIHGQLVRTLVEGERLAGRYIVTWNGRDDSRQVVSTGVYLYRLVAGKTVLDRKMALLK